MHFLILLLELIEIFIILFIIFAVCVTAKKKGALNGKINKKMESGKLLFDRRAKKNKK